MDDNRQLFIDAEYCIDKYFDDHLQSRLDFYRSAREAQKTGELASGFGVRNTLLPGADYANHVTMSWPSQDVIRLGTDLSRDDGYQQDMKTLADAWRTAAIAKVGKERYIELSTRLGCDLAEAYVNHRMSMRMVDYEVDHYRMQGTSDYLAYSARKASFFRDSLSNPRDALQLLIEKRTVEKYNPSGLEKSVGKALGTVTDFVVTLPFAGVHSWGGLASLVGTEIAADVALDGALPDNSEACADVSMLVSKAVFGEDRDVLASLRKQTVSVNPYSSDIVRLANDQLGNKILRQSSSNLFTKKEYMPQYEPDPIGDAIPDYAAQSRHMLEEHFAGQGQAEGSSHYETANDGHAQDNDAGRTLPDGKQQSFDGWGSLLDGLGLGGFGDVGKNLGYVLGMLPDLMVGMFTGKTRNLNIKDNLFPLAAIFGGIFVKNPLLKLLLIGLGGANLLNKAGHEALDNARSSGVQPVRKFIEYGDEPLSPRLKDPHVKDDCLWVTIDGDPNVIAIRSEKALAAYEQGKLPLNTLANAVLARYDEQQLAVSEAYARGEEEEQTVTRQRGIQ